ncbi:MAG: hypothetical protein ABW168_20770 [Sedimenticola sp.]
MFGQRDLLVYLSMNIHADIKSRITYSEQLLPLTDEGLEAYIQGELDAVRLGAILLMTGPPNSSYGRCREISGCVAICVTAAWWKPAG